MCFDGERRMMGSLRLNLFIKHPWRMPSMTLSLPTSLFQTISTRRGSGISRSHFVSNSSSGKPFIMGSPQSRTYGMEMIIGISFFLDVERNTNPPPMLSFSATMLKNYGPCFDSVRAADPEEAKALVVIRGIKAVLQVGLERVLLLTNCNRLVRAFETRSDDLSWRALTLAPDLVSPSSLFVEFHFKYINRFCNFEAYALAKQGRQQIVNDTKLEFHLKSGYDYARATDFEEAETVTVIRGMEAALGKDMKRVMVLTNCRPLISAFEAGSTDLSWGALTLAPEMSDLKNTILSMVTKGWTSTSYVDPIVLSPNLTTCHHSLTDEDHGVYCCPPNPEAEESIFDFKFPDSSSPIRVRRAAHHVDKDYIAKYNKAISIMKSLPYTDPRNWYRQADMHCLYCTGSYNQEHSNSLMKIHRSWLFFPWHRMMIYFHERVVGSLIGDETFALPFWNWDSPEGMMIPDFYMNGSFFDVDRDRSHLPPQVADLNFDYDFAINATTLPPRDQTAVNTAFMYNQMVSGAKKAELFMGCPYKAGEEGFCDAPGTIEAAPHNALHTWVGCNLNPERENMGAFYSAARDPIFYGHHSNIDRLWEVWRKLRGTDDPAIMDAEWLDSYFYFHNEKSQLVRIRIRDVLDITKLRYKFETIDNPWLNARPKPSVPPKIARHILKMRDMEENGLGSTSSAFGANCRTLDSTIRVTVHRPKTGRTKKEKDEEEEVLVVFGIDIKKDRYVKFDVYINAADETIIGPESREFAGTFVSMRKGVRLVMHKDDVISKKKTYLKLGISELLEDLEADDEEKIWVTVVPRSGTGTIEGIRFEYLR
ncbi:hypothetical protein GIB67_042810 [Kingdonia uniflora]|uniref:Tyrosinase copper-binding domain-containing protein n=1 Tax=Kingdonia uniflora TaxID=39325 RepID=A0A7J7L126_9MAGN|nr:hypothetical protein GIB67_042810 [Kingdonia uniflora]